MGFRYTAESTALALGLRGWVRNLPDDRVEALCEGSRKVLERFLAEISAGPMKRYIQGVDTSWDKAAGEFDDFRIRYF